MPTFFEAIRNFFSNKKKHRCVLADDGKWHCQKYVNGRWEHCIPDFEYESEEECQANASANC